MHKLTKRANHNVQTDVRTDPNYGKASLLKTIHIMGTFAIIIEEKNYIYLI